MLGQAGEGGHDFIQSLLDAESVKTFGLTHKKKRQIMAPILDNFVEEEFTSRTHQYRKVMKPLLERKRRARINACLDELKDLMLFALEQEERGEGGVVRLEKADILEVTVRHMRKLKAADSLCVTPGTTYAQRFRSGFTTCAAEVGRFIASPSSGFDRQAAKVVVSRLSDCVRTVEALPAPLLAASYADCPTQAVTSSAPSSVLPPPALLQGGGPLDLSQTGARQSDPSWRPW